MHGGFEVVRLHGGLCGTCLPRFLISLCVWSHDGHAAWQFCFCDSRWFILALDSPQVGEARLRRRICLWLEIDAGISSLMYYCKVRIAMDPLRAIGTRKAAFEFNGVKRVVRWGCTRMEEQLVWNFGWWSSSEPLTHSTVPHSLIKHPDIR